MIFAKIWSAHLDKLDGKGQSLVAKVKEYEFNTPSEHWGPGAEGIIEISGEGRHKGIGESRAESWNWPDENEAEFDYEDKLDIKLEKKDIIDICKLALDKNIIEISDVISEEKLRELRNSSEILDSMKSELDKMLSIFSKKLK